MVAVEAVVAVTLALVVIIELRQRGEERAIVVQVTMIIRCKPW